jgi:hypothetical protein
MDQVLEGQLWFSEESTRRTEKKVWVLSVPKQWWSLEGSPCFLMIVEVGYGLCDLGTSGFYTLVQDMKGTTVVNM